VVEVRRVPVGWLVVLGRTSLMLYFLHHVLVLTISHEWLGLKLDSWWWYALANVLLTVVLVWLGRLWLEIRSVAARRLQTV
jgi:peptidoglycan/LPS O-acetylase OafA/YrhL